MYSIFAMLSFKIYEKKIIVSHSFSSCSFSLSIQAQTKKWTLEDCVKYAIDNNISIKQTELDTKTAEY